MKMHGRTWHEWKRLHADAIVALGLPRSLTATELQWQQFLDGIIFEDPNDIHHHCLEVLSGVQLRQLQDYLLAMTPPTKPVSQVLKVLHTKTGIS
ncbi:hypothetical protein BH11PLA2_BH11PLA2_52480 [soil metagenome]